MESELRFTPYLSNTLIHYVQSRLFDIPGATDINFMAKYQETYDGENYDICNIHIFQYKMEILKFVTF